MKTLSVNIISRIKWFISVKGFRSNPVTIPDNREDRLQKDKIATETNDIINEEFDLAQFQRKAYCGNYFVGPYIFLNPDLFD